MERKASKSVSWVITGRSFVAATAAIQKVLTRTAQHPHNVTPKIGRVRFTDIGKCRGIAQDLDGLFEFGQVVLD